MLDNCFVNNNFVGEGVLIAESKDSLVSSEGNFVNQDDGLVCQFIAVKPPLEDISCVDAEATECSIEGVDPEEGDSCRATGRHLFFYGCKEKVRR